MAHARSSWKLFFTECYFCLAVINWIQSFFLPGWWIIHHPCLATALSYDIGSTILTKYIWSDFKLNNQWWACGGTSILSCPQWTWIFTKALVKCWVLGNRTSKTCQRFVWQIHGKRSSIISTKLVLQYPYKHILPRTWKAIKNLYEPRWYACTVEGLVNGTWVLLLYCICMRRCSIKCLFSSTPIKKWHISK